MVVDHRYCRIGISYWGSGLSLSGSLLCVAGLYRACNSCIAVQLVHDVDLVIGPDSTLLFTILSTVEAFGY